MGKDLDPVHPTREAPRDHEDSPARSEHSATDSTSENEEPVPQWVQQTLAKSQSDGRAQPWKKIFKSEKALEHIENTMEYDKDLVVVPPKLPSAGEATIFEQQSLAG